jgi:hypothetical protein
VLRSLAITLPDEPGSVIAISRPRLVADVVLASDEPWVIFEKGWWKLNPKRPDFRPRTGSLLLAGRGDPKARMVITKARELEQPLRGVDAHRVLR